MHARITRFSLQTDKIDDTKAIAETAILPEMKEMSGFKALYVLGDRTSGDSLVITLWDSEEAEQSSRESVGQRFEKLADTMAGPPESSTAYEVYQSYVAEPSPAM